MTDYDPASTVPASADDRRDGFIHLSTAAQVVGSLTRHFADHQAVVLLRIDETRLSPAALRYEPSRGGALFPHYYGDIPVGAVVAVWPLSRRGADWDLPQDLRQQLSGEVPA